MADAALQLPSTTETTTELVVIKSTPAKVEFNIEELRTKVRKALEPYDIVVTADTLKGAKELMADLNKKAKSIKDVFKGAAKEATAQVDEQGEQVAALVEEIIESRTKLKAQVEKFETERKAEAYEKLVAAQNQLWESEGIQDEFRRADVGKLVTLTCLTAKGALTSGTMTKLKDLVAGDKGLQTQTEHRLLMLENESYKAGLKAVLTRDHVEAFLFSDQETYQQRLSAMLSSELRRQEATEEATRQQYEQEQTRQQEAQKREQAKQQEPQSLSSKPEPTLEKQIAELDERIQDATMSAQYCEDRAAHRRGMEHVTQLKSERAELLKQEPVAQQEAYMLCGIHDTTKPLTQPFRTNNPSEAIQAALSESANRSTQGEPFYVAVWTQSAGRTAIVDGLSGEIYQRVSA
ncbi:hypothetical protein DN730_07960 [Marinomonas piezotolerans]|uniref:DUF1351 domain-containing protein n=1 Tax=Marinomonas piezotolerans TaxID=2213058 RepID=A0A370U989_9GAMM|nr:DUF1351 domain-containing protein [Marinomonas piezotolerans]RDL44331.1 hypothetical protein DN730_07960 [Marinomonas piezotolerans]